MEAALNSGGLVDPALSVREALIGIVPLGLEPRAQVRCAAKCQDPDQFVRDDEALVAFVRTTEIVVGLQRLIEGERGGGTAPLVRSEVA